MDSSLLLHANVFFFVFCFAQLIYVHVQSTGSSACANAPCQLCQLTRANPLGFKCTCPPSKVLLFDGACESRFTRTIYTYIHAYIFFKAKSSNSSSCNNVCSPPVTPCGCFVATSPRRPEVLVRHHERHHDGGVQGHDGGGGLAVLRYPRRHPVV